LPACTACEKTGREQECSAANDQFARGKERSYVAALESRIEKLQKRLEYAKAEKASIAKRDTGAAPSFDPGRRDSLAFIREAIHRKDARQRENSDVNSLVSKLGYLSVKATTRDFEFSTTNMTFARLVLAASTNDPVPEPDGSNSLPPKPAASALFKFYKANISSLYPVFTDNTFLDSLLDKMYDERTPPTKSSDLWIFWMVLAIGSSAQSRSQTDEHYDNGVKFVARAMGFADAALTPGYMAQIQSLLLLTQYAMLDPAHFDSWQLIGFTCRAVTDLGYHQDPPKSQVKDHNGLEARRKLFYCVYALDRTISMVHARPFSFTDDAISVALPSASPLAVNFSAPPDGPASPQPPADASLQLFKLRCLQSSWYQELFQSNPADALPDAAAFVWKACADMQIWFQNLPKALPANIQEMFKLEVLYSFVFCLSPSARAPYMTTYGRALIFEHAICYIDAAFKAAHGDSAGFYTYHDALRLFFMGSQLVAVLRETCDVLLAGWKGPLPISNFGQALGQPLIPYRSGGGDNLDCSLRAIECVSQTLRKYGERWEDALHLMESFGAISQDVVQGLDQRKTMRDAAALIAATERDETRMHGQHHPM